MQGVQIPRGLGNESMARLLTGASVVMNGETRLGRRGGAGARAEARGAEGATAVDRLDSRQDKIEGLGMLWPSVSTTGRGRGSRPWWGAGCKLQLNDARRGVSAKIQEANEHRERTFCSLNQQRTTTGTRQ